MVSRIYIVVSMLAYVFFTGCLPHSTLYNTPLAHEGNVLLYLQPLPQESQNLRFTIENISALRDGGSANPFFLKKRELKGLELSGRQILLASGVLPAGSYTGLSIQIGKAFIKGEEGESALFVQEAPLIVGHPFTAKRNTMSTLFLTLTLSGRITEGVYFRPVFSLVSPSRELTSITGYISNTGSDAVTVFNKKTMQVIDTLSTGRRPRELVLDQRLGKVYLAVSGDDAIEVIDIFKGDIIDKISLNFGDDPTELALTPDGRTLVSVNRGSNSVSIIDVLSLYESWRIKVGETPTDVAIDPTGLRAYVTSSQASTLSVIDLSQQILSTTVIIEGAPIRCAFNREGDRLYVLCRDLPDLLVIDPATLTVTEKIFIGMEGISIKVDTKTDLILVGKSVGDIYIIEPFSSMFVDTIQVAGGVAHMAIDDEENNLLIVISDDAILQRADLTRKKVDAELETGSGGYALVVMGER